MGRPVVRSQWNSSLLACLGKNDEFCTSDLEVCLLGTLFPCFRYGSNVERLSSTPRTFANHCLPYSSLGFLRKFLFGSNCLAPWFSYPSRTAILGNFNLEGSCEAISTSCGRCRGYMEDDEQREQYESAWSIARDLLQSGNSKYLKDEMDLGHGNNNHLSFGGDQANNLGSRVDRKDEKQKRFTVFKDIFLYIHEHNQGSRSYKLANQFADLSREEFKATYLGAKLDTKKRLLRSPSAHTSILIARICQSPLTGDKREPWRSREGPGFMWKLFREMDQSFFPI